MSTAVDGGAFRIIRKPDAAAGVGNDVRRRILVDAAAIDLDDVIVVETNGNQLVAVKRTDIDLESAQGRELALADNATGKANLAWDEELISAMAEKWDFEPGDWGVEIPDGEEESQPQGKEEQETGAIEVRCKPGDIWQLGNHRLMCGDSIDLEQVKRLLGG